MAFWKSKSAGPKIGDLFWHLYDGGVLIGLLREPMPRRIAYIKAHEPKAYCEMHLRLMKPVRGTLSPACTKAVLAFDIDDLAYRAAYETFHNAKAICDMADQANLKAVKAYGLGGKVKSGKYMAMHYAVEAEHAAHVAFMETFVGPDGGSCGAGDLQQGAGASHTGD
jgi:hypothetical protein